MGIYHHNISEAISAEKQETAKQAIQSLSDYWSLDQISKQIQTPYELLVDLIVGLPIAEAVVNQILEKLGVSA
ncbi:hypothetical protein [Acinetobacter pollinis]|uniref:hypothetical protein n=1 Tax=Acinetobacter pollinis TaxID=2605270 RepID=UPI0018C318AF|nr:hypothetical protein [Acinetobacter pollinis]MBF7693451.1 hypothetical protein [Acinetobacter pollinis]MBF7700963.1 hypothetical protein [Acinetobacter pollinis]